ncbi:hypothetical protein KIM372_08260 [Bombiscardovia nodaiensis]|uniref:Uncharacterized protein n=1 Tax=Bombiscardovia nodaiensis TaxID=2932181 RepID=A0ABM8B7S8_9BIFI|nr:hypothetical protein KIM372_08260 [Bombiscardovia nodaiensis]
MSLYSRLFASEGELSLVSLHYSGLPLTAMAYYFKQGEECYTLVLKPHNGL